MIEDLAFREWCREMYDKYKDNPEYALVFKNLGDLMKDEIIENLGLAWRMRQYGKNWQSRKHLLKG